MRCESGSGTVNVGVVVFLPKIVLAQIETVCNTGDENDESAVHFPKISKLEYLQTQNNTCLYYKTQDTCTTTLEFLLVLGREP